VADITHCTRGGLAGPLMMVQSPHAYAVIAKATILSPKLQ
jgi:hypothetical protein